MNVTKCLSFYTEHIELDEKNQIPYLLGQRLIRKFFIFCVYKKNLSNLYFPRLSKYCRMLFNYLFNTYTMVDNYWGSFDVAQICTFDDGNWRITHFIINISNIFTYNNAYKNF